MRAIACLGLVTGCSNLLGISDPRAAPIDATRTDATMVDAPTKGGDASAIDAAAPGFQFWRFVLTSHDESAGGGSVVATEFQMQFGGQVHVLTGATLTTSQGTNVIDPHPNLGALVDGDLTTTGGTSYVSLFDGATIDIDLGQPEQPSAFGFAISGFQTGAPSDPPLEWTPGMFQVCSSATGQAPFDCTSLDGGTRDMWSDHTLRLFLI